ncbi:MAG: PKD domain-containing protein, partial [Bacteroidetes bacterium]|nr:PKD domain-containing protein [Bacteroidota bacterium]
KYLDSSYWFTYTYTSNNGCSASDSINLRIVDKPHNLQIGADSTVCFSDGMVKLNANLKGGYWYGNAIKKGSDYYFDPTNKIADSAYALFYNYEDSVGCKSLASKYLKVYPSLNFGVANDTQFCFKENEIITLNAFPKGGLWIGKNISQSIGSILIDSSLLGINSFTYSITDSFNCKYTDSTQVKVAYQPVIDIGQDDTLCISGKYRHVFKPNKLGGNWTGPGIINPNINSVTIDLETITPATYTYSYTNSDGCGDSDTIVLFIGKRATSYHKPSVTSGEVPLTVFFKNSSSAHSYNWNFGDGNASTDKEPRHTYTSPGTFKVVLVAKDSTEFCAATSSSTIEVDKAGNIDGIDNPSIEVYPTITNGMLHIISELNKPCSVML